MQLLTSINWDLKCACFRSIDSLINNLYRLSCAVNEAALILLHQAAFILHTYLHPTH